ncbi:class I SAM-dependent methyltransferase [Chitinophaga agrisoli]|uniref:Class I SAM-dependent methyltransferase n=1 Tax=Chitinophaga agrisoli TaxID=2607653 RepID=A0A5B2VKZ8_9BACT|nr:class I SAM-dependent methyltransferase [Chitinophaga agrisoli]KAA2239494.1 class I SAM-dependent methyltransferase [Chitinophaga agrisoli]
MTEEEIKAVALQLGHPQGEEGIKVAAKLHEINGSMIQRTIDLLHCRDQDTVLEIGPGNGGYAPYVLSRAAGIHYYGIDISATVIELAKENLAAEIAAGTASFILGNGVELPYTDNFFDKVFTVNTLYFWEDPLQQLAEIYRVLKPGGILIPGIRSPHYMKTLPFTQYGFRMYDATQAAALLEKAGFSIADTVEENVEIKTERKTEVDERIYIVAKKP